MAERTSVTYKFERSKENPKLNDVELQIELSQEELDSVLKAHEIQDSPEVWKEVWRGSGCVRYFVTRYPIPHGYSLVKPREELLQELRSSKKYIDENEKGFAKESPTVVDRFREISSLLGSVLGDDSEQSPER